MVNIVVTAKKANNQQTINKTIKQTANDQSKCKKKTQIISKIVIVNR